MSLTLKLLCAAWRMKKGKLPSMCFLTIIFPSSEHRQSNLWSTLARDSLDILARTGVGKPLEKRWTPFSRFGRDGEEGQRWMPFSKLTRPRFGKRASSEENIVGRDLDLAHRGVRQRFGSKKLDLEI